MSQSDPPVSVLVPVSGTADAGAPLERTLAALAPVRSEHGRPEVVVVATEPRLLAMLPVGVRSVRAARGAAVAAGAQAARSERCVLLAPGDQPTADDVASWCAGRGPEVVPTAVLRGLGGTDATVGARLEALAPALEHGGLGRALQVLATPTGPADASYESAVGPHLDVLTELDGVSVATTDGARAVGEAMAAELEHVRAHLVAQPDDHPRFVADVERRGLRHVDWSVLNRGRARELALLYSFPPWNATSGLVAARRIRARGALVDVVTQNMDDLRPRDPASLAIAAPFVAEQHIIEGRATFSGWTATDRFVRMTRRLLEGDGPLAGRQYDATYSRAMFPASHVAAALHKLRRPETWWRAEFSDPLAKDIHGQPRQGEVRPGPLLSELQAGLEAAGASVPAHLDLFPWIEHLAYALADEILFTNANQRDYMLGYCPDPALRQRVLERSHVAHHPTLPPPFYQRQPSSYTLDPARVHIGYFGVFYATRGLREVTDALTALPGPVRARVQLHVFTSNPDTIADEVATAGLADVVRVNGYRPFLEFLHLTTRFDVLLVNDADHAGTNPYLPSKLSDYLGSASDIWAISQPGSVLSRQDVAYTSSLHDVDAATAILTQIAGGAR